LRSWNFLRKKQGGPIDFLKGARGVAIQIFCKLSPDSTVNAGANDKTSGGWNWKKDDRSTPGKKAVLWVAAGCLAEG
jgi:hypothetical protein